MGLCKDCKVKFDKVKHEYGVDGYFQHSFLHCHHEERDMDKLLKLERRLFMCLKNPENGKYVVVKTDEIKPLWELLRAALAEERKKEKPAYFTTDRIL